MTQKELDRLYQEAEALRDSPDRIAYREARKHCLLAQAKWMEENRP